MSHDKARSNGDAPHHRDDKPDPYQAQRDRMVEVQIAARGIDDPLVLAAMCKVPRQRFVTADLVSFAHGDGALPIACGQTISQPYIVALMTEALRLKGGEKVLEIGTGSGYAAAVLAEIAGRVITVECVKELADSARRTLADLGYDNVEVIEGDGTRGYEPEAPYDAITVTAGGPEVPGSLRRQLKIGGNIVIPVGNWRTMQTLIRETREGEDEFTQESLCEVRFVPLIGAEGWDGEGDTDQSGDGRLW